MRYLLLLTCVFVFAACHTPPEAFEKGLANLNEKKWDKAIESFNQVTAEDKDWLDSAVERKNAAFGALVNEGDWKRTFRTLDKNIDDDDFIFAGTEYIENFYFDLIGKGKSDSVLLLLEANKAKLAEYIDTVFTTKVLNQCEDSLFAGLWDGQGGLDGQEIYFKRDGSSLHAYSNKSKSGWIKDGIIYKELRYNSANEWKVKPKVFQTNYWGDQSSYYSKKGSIKLLSADTLQIGYESLGDEDLFVRKK